MSTITGTAERNCRERRLALQDTIQALGGKWRIFILCALQNGDLRFSDLETRLPGIRPKVLASDLKSLEAHLLVNRQVNPTRPVTVTYSLTPHARHLWPLVDALVGFGLEHRRSVKAGMKAGNAHVITL
ncbi:winged helix-turn-helix transcriptional regulator [Chitinophaga sp. NPDC101104]|uniref:winged helix-turn-helix transcriptional regulator n=1 Tax=Chitinophaga sp. NPDC101104 TaxID=3390561 RepID=UPI003CFDC7EE